MASISKSGTTRPSVSPSGESISNHLLVCFQYRAWIRVMTCQKWQLFLPILQLENYGATSDRSWLKVILGFSQLAAEPPQREISHTAARPLPLRRSVPVPLHSTPSAPAGPCRWRWLGLRRLWGFIACWAAAKAKERLPDFGNLSACLFGCSVDWLRGLGVS